MDEDRRVRPRMMFTQNVKIMFGDAVFYNIDPTAPDQALRNRLQANKANAGVVFFNGLGRGDILAAALVDITVTLTQSRDELYTGFIIFTFQHSKQEDFIVKGDLTQDSEFGDYFDVLEFLDWEI